VTLEAGHPWPLSGEEAVKIQRQLAPLVRRQLPAAEIRLIAGADCCYAGNGATCAAAVVLWDFESGATVEVQSSLSEVRFPYVPGLFAFREAPAILRVLDLLSTPPQLLICDGHGLAHPRRFGLACHLGVLTGIPAIGCGKRRLCGTFVEPGITRGSSSPLNDRGETVGRVLRTRAGVRPVFVSVGHLMDLSTAERMILACTPRYRLPEPLRLAHRAAVEASRREVEASPPL
jgi:deoxyribonuclease V